LNNWTPADLVGRNVKKTFAQKTVEYKRPVGRPKKLPVEILKCKRGGSWAWSDHVSPDEADAGDRYHDDWRASGLEPLQTQQFRDSNCGSQARSGSTDWCGDDIDDYVPPGSTGGMPKSGAAVAADEGVTRRVYPNGTLHIVFETKEEQNPDDHVPDTVDRIERDMARSGILSERPEKIVYDKRNPKRMSAKEVARLILEYEERTGKTDHHVKAKKRGKRHMASELKRGMQPLADPSACEQWPASEGQGRRRIAWSRARKALPPEAAQLVDRIILFGWIPYGENISAQITGFRAALHMLTLHYRLFDLDTYIASQEEKANQWLQSSSLCQPKPLPGWKTRLRSMACR
jgi:hypothetical protein